MLAKRLKRLVVTAVLGTVMALPAFAGNVLLPSETDGAPAANLGLIPQATEPAPQEKPPEVKAPPIEKQPAPSPIPTPVPVPIPPPAPEPPLTPTSSALNILLDEKTLWNEQDIRAIVAQLGLSPQQVRSACRIGLAGTLISDQGTYAVDTGLGQQTTVAYDGNISQIMLGRRALCNAAPHPASPLVQPVNGSWVVSLGSAYCAMKSLTTMRPQVLTIVRTPDGNDSCLLR